jgi:hypothetical protein
LKARVYFVNQYYKGPHAGGHEDHILATAIIFAESEEQAKSTLAPNYIMGPIGDGIGQYQEPDFVDAGEVEMAEALPIVFPLGIY